MKQRQNKMWINNYILDKPSFNHQLKWKSHDRTLQTYISLRYLNRFHTVVLPSPVSNWACECHRKLQCFPFIFSETPCSPAAANEVALAQLFDQCDPSHAAAANYIVEQFTQMWKQRTARLHTTHGLTMWGPCCTTLPGWLQLNLELSWNWNNFYNCFAFQWAIDSF